MERKDRVNGVGRMYDLPLGKTLIIEFKSDRKCLSDQELIDWRF